MTSFKNTTWGSDNGTWFLMDTKLINSKNSYESLIVTLSIGFSGINTYKPCALYTWNNQIIPLTFEGFNRNYINKSFGSISTFIKKLNPHIEGYKLKYIPGSFGIYTTKNIVSNPETSGLDLYINDNYICHYKVTNIDPNIYRGPDFKFVLERSNTSNPMIDLYKSVENVPDDELESVIAKNYVVTTFSDDQTIAILTKIMPDTNVSFRRLKIKYGKMIANKNVISAIKKDKWYINTSPNYLIAEIYVNYYNTYIKGDVDDPTMQ